MASTTRAAGTERKPTEARRQEIIEQSARLFAEKGYHGTSISDICEATGLGKGSLYYHIDSKEELLFEIHDAFAKPIYEAGEKLAADPDLTPPEKLRQLSRALLRLVVDYNDYVTVFYREYYTLIGERREAIRKKRKQFEQVVHTILNDGMESGYFRRIDEVFVNGFLGMHNYAYVWYREGRLSPEEVADVFIDTLLDGILGTRDSERL
jgi:AcrR family transcriptional regulator